MPVRKLTAVHIEAFEAELQREGWVKPRAKQKIKEGEEAPIQEKRGLSSQTALHVHRVLSQALGHAVRLGVLFKNPARQVKPPRPPSREIKILHKGEITTVIGAAKEAGLYVPVLVAVTTGMRRGELLALRWSDIDLKAASLTVNQSLERIKGKFVFKSPKTKTSRRTITLPAFWSKLCASTTGRSLKNDLNSGSGETLAGSYSHAPMASRWTLTRSANPSVGLLPLPR